MHNRNHPLWQAIKDSIEDATSVGETTTTEIADKLFVYLNNIVEQEKKEYTISLLAEMIQRLQ